MPGGRGGDIARLDDTARERGTEHAGECRSRRDFGSERGSPDQAAYEALTDLSAYALILDAECHRLGNRILELAEVDSSVAERTELLRERVEISEEATALRRTIASLQELCQSGAARRCRPSQK